MTGTHHLVRRRALLWLGAAVSFTPFAGASSAAEHDAAARVLLDPVPRIVGARRTIAVGQFDVMGPYANASATNVGGPIAAMLSTALSESDDFIVVERDAVAQMITEMDMAKSRVTGGTAAPMPGSVLPAQYLVVGSVTEFTAPGAGSGGGLSIGGSTALTLGGSSGGVGLDLRIVDTRTGAVVKAFKVRRKLSSANLGLTSSYKGVPVATNGFFNTRLGDATRRALYDAVIVIVQTLGAIPWRGQVVKAEGRDIYINAGTEAGLRVGDKLSLERVAETLTDPATGAVLSERMVQLGTVTVTSLEPKLAIGSYEARIDAAPARGDFLILRP